MQGEVWKEIKGFEGFYEVSNLGRVKRVACTGLSTYGEKTCYKSYNTLIIKVNNDTRGYPQVSLGFNKKRVARVHRLVAEAFLDLPSEKLRQECLSAGLSYVMINHIDEDRCNAVASNLEWCSPLYNNTYGKSRKGIKSMSGSASKSAVLTEENVLEIVSMLKNKVMSQETIAEKFGVKQITISNIWTGRSWSHFTGIPWKERTRGRKRGSVSISEQTMLQ